MRNLLKAGQNLIFLFPIWKSAIPRSGERIQPMAPGELVHGTSPDAFLKVFEIADIHKNI